MIQRCVGGGPGKVGITINGDGRDGGVFDIWTWPLTGPSPGVAY